MKIKQGKRGRFVWVFDNSDTLKQTIDNFTIIYPNGNVYGCSHQPFHPQGLGMSYGNLVDNIMTVKYGYSWRERCNVKACIREEVRSYLNTARDDSNWLGKEIIDFETLPLDVQKYIKQNL